MNIQEVEKHVKFDLIFTLLVILGVGLCFLLSIVFIFKPINAKALSESNITNNITAGENCSSHPSGSVCTTQISPYSSANPCGNGDAWCVTYNSTIVDNIVLGMGFYVPTQIEPNTLNTITIKGSYFANVNYSCNTTNGMTGCNVVRVSSTQLNINFKYTGNNLAYNTQFYIGSYDRGFNNASNYFRILSVIHYDNPISDDSGSSSFDDTGIINNQNQNTQDIINNSNQNSQDIQSSIFQSAKDMIEQLANQCPNMLNVSTVSACRMSGGGIACDGSTLTRTDGPSGSVIFNNTSTWYGFLTDYINCDEIRTYYLDYVRNFTNNGQIVVSFYNSSKTYMNQQIFSLIPVSGNSISFTPPTGAKYLKISFQVNGTGSFTFTNIRLNATSSKPFCAFGSQNNKIDQLEGAIGGVRSALDTNNDIIQDQYDLQQQEYDFLTDNTQPTPNNTEISNVLGLVSVNDPLIYLTTLPITLLNKINVALNTNQCTDFTIGSFGTIGGVNFGNYTFKFPCLNIGNYIGNSLWNTIDVIVGIGLLALSLYKFYHMITNILSLGAEEKASKISHYFTPMEFLSLIVEGDVPGITIRKGVVNE